MSCSNGMKKSVYDWPSLSGPGCQFESNVAVSLHKRSVICEQTHFSRDRPTMLATDTVYENPW